ncbi:MAG: hypothetical protein ACI835_001477 [Planctomycetota bacterium]|jgi:hypothetical protein
MESGCRQRSAARAFNDARPDLHFSYGLNVSACQSSGVPKSRICRVRFETLQGKELLLHKHGKGNSLLPGSAQFRHGVVLPNCAKDLRQCTAAATALHRCALTRGTTKRTQGQHNRCSSLGSLDCLFDPLLSAQGRNTIRFDSRKLKAAPPAAGSRYQNWKSALHRQGSGPSPPPSRRW